LSKENSLPHNCPPPGELGTDDQRVWSYLTDTAAFKTFMAFITPLRLDFCGLHNPVYTVFTATFAVIFHIFGDVRYVAQYYS